MIEITLRKETDDITYKQDFINIKMMLKGLEIQKIFSEANKNGIFETELDKIVEFEVALYGNQFTKEEFMEGYRAEKIFAKVLEDLNIALGNATQKLEEIPVEKN